MCLANNVELDWSIIHAGDVAPVVHSFVFSYCKPQGIVCPAVDDFPSVMNEQQSVTACGTGMTGFAYRVCENGTFGQVHYEMCTYKYPEDLKYEKEYFDLIAGVNVDINPPTYKNIITHFSISPTLPEGLLFDETTGAIHGTITVSMPNITYTVTGENPDGYAKVKISMSSKLMLCQQRSSTNDTDIDAIVREKCGNGSIGYRIWICTMGDEQPMWKQTGGFCISPVIYIPIIVGILTILFIGIYMLGIKARKPMNVRVKRSVMENTSGYIKLLCVC
jgi:hypothetical protein